LHIHADDHRADGLGALGNPVLKTPHLDEIARRGMVFTHCYTQGSMIGAVCLPSRTMLLTGRSLFRIPSGKAATAGEAPLPLPRALKAVGYETFHAGKSGNEYRAGIEAFDRNLVFDDRTIELAYAPDVWSSHWYAGVAARAALVLREIQPERSQIYRSSALRERV
jgi:arylsulfatase A-like enzyme